MAYKMLSDKGATTCEGVRAFLCPVLASFRNLFGGNHDMPTRPIINESEMRGIVDRNTAAEGSAETAAKDDLGKALLSIYDIEAACRTAVRDDEVNDVAGPLLRLIQNEASRCAELLDGCEMKLRPGGAA